MQPTIPEIDLTAAGGPERATAGIDRLGDTAHKAVDRATTAAHGVAERATAAAQQLADGGHKLASTGDYWAEATRECVRRHPIASVGVALGAGVLLSLMTRRSH